MDRSKSILAVFSSFLVMEVSTDNWFKAFIEVESHALKNLQFCKESAGERKISLPIQ